MMNETVNDVIQVIMHEREGRDRGWWDQMERCYHPDSHVRASWFTGTGPEFVAASREMAARGDVSRHRISVPVVHQNGDRAVVIVPMAIELRFSVREVEVLAELAALIAAGELTVEISARYPLEQVREAYAELAHGHTRGKIVLRMR